MSVGTLGSRVKLPHKHWQPREQALLDPPHIVQVDFYPDREMEATVRWTFKDGREFENVYKISELEFLDEGE